MWPPAGGGKGLPYAPRTAEARIRALSTMCYDNGGSIWSPIALHMVLNALILASAVLGA